MFDSVPSYIHSNVPLFALIFCGIAAAAVSYLFYKRTIPPLPLFWQLTLAIFRGVSIAIILLLLFAPEITLIWQRKIPVNIALAADRSGSMRLEDRMTQSSDVIERLQNELASRANVKLYLFDTDTTSEVTFPFVAGEGGTDISAALSGIGKSSFNPQIILMISDGNFTSGPNPVYSVSDQKARVYTIGVGDTAIAPDLLISNIRTNKIVYQNKPTTIQAEIQLRGKQNVRTTVALRRKNKTIAVRQLNVDQANIVYPVKIEITPDQLGINRYELDVEAFSGEKILENNRFSFSLDVLKGKLFVGMIADEPDLDLKFSSILFKKHQDFNAQIILTNRKYARLYSENIKADSLDLLVLFNVPADAFRNRMGTLFKQKSLPMMIFLKKRPESEALQYLQSVSPIETIQSGPLDLEYEVVQTTQGRLWPAMNVYSDEATNSYFWTRCPPIAYPFSDVTYGSGSTIVLQSNSSPAKPVVLRFTKAGRRGLIFIGKGFWRWHFMLSEDRQFNNGWADILENSARWLTSGGTFENVILSTRQKNYQTGESIRFNVQVYDGSLSPVNDANVRVTVSDKEQRFEVEADYIEQSNYSGIIPSLGAGTYVIEAQAWRNDVQIGTAKKEVVVSPVNAEFISTRQDYRFLNELAQATGGKYIPADSLQNLMSNLDLNPRIERIEQSFELWQRSMLLIFLIFLFLFEWFIRKRKGLA